jgi:hypothetical protein
MACDHKWLRDVDNKDVGWFGWPTYVGGVAWWGWHLEILSSVIEVLHKV